MPQIRRKPKFKRLKNTLTLAFLLVSLVPLTVIGLFFLQSHSNDLEAQSKAHLTSVRDNAAQQLNDYFKNLKSESLGFVRSELAYASGGRFYGLINAFRSLGDDMEHARQNAQQRYKRDSSDQLATQIARDSAEFDGSERYRLMHLRYHSTYLELVNRSEFDDILLVDINGNVAYSVYKRDYYGTNLTDEKYTGTQLGKTFERIKQRSKGIDKDETTTIPVVYSDFDLNASQPHAWFAAPIVQQGYLHSYALFRLPKEGIDSLLNNMHSPEMEALLLNQHRQVVSSNLSIPYDQDDALLDDTVFSGISAIDTLTSDIGDRYLVAYEPIIQDTFTWTVAFALPESVAFANVHNLQTIFLAIMLTGILIVTLTAHYLANFITAPLLKLTWAAERVSGGELDTPLFNTDRKDEIGRLAVSFERMQRSIRDKINTIGEQNTALEANLATISRQNIELKQADKLKDDFLATTSHELRTPLHGMVGIAEALIAGANGPISASHKYQLNIIVSSGQRLSNLVDDLLDYHKMRYGHVEIQRCAVNISNSTSLVLELSSHLIKGKNIRIINQIDSSTPMVFADPERSEQVLYNLVGNAIKYTNEGKIVLTATHIDGMLRIQVSDTGQGIPAENLEQIFEPLTQVSKGTQRYQQGAGLGLSISRQLVEVMGGTLYVSSQPQVGTTFSFTLPLATQQQIEQRPTHFESHFQSPKVSEALPETLEEVEESLDGKLILVVDDEPVNIQILTSFLRLEGYRVITAQSGQHALTLIDSHRPQLVLLDIMMPEMNGFDVCEAIRLQFDRAQLPIIMLTALSQAEDKVAGFTAGANDFLSKPFNKQELAARLRAHFDASDAELQRIANQQLSEELKYREQVEANLLETQGQLLEQLDTAPEAMVAIDHKKRIKFANQSACKLFKRHIEQLKRSKADELFAPRFLDTDKQHWVGEIDIFVEDTRQHISGDILRLAEGTGLQALFILSRGDGANTERVENLEMAVEALSDYAFAGDKQQLQKLKELGGEFTRLADKVSGESHDKQDMMRELLVDTMNHALDYWESEQGQTKFTFAEQSGLWRVYLDRSTLQTRTLDKYLRIETLPKTPRWRTVLASIDYILEHAQNQGSQRYQLEQLREKLQKLLTS
ncbi:histidine kinase [Vibrio sp. qd031]|uniref:ATP-binding protein n=1 Tax=Vibrio sp. qd031 TaxID=1603038 RepID=UPI000A0FAD64|nr:ATP-binding protein [Vibrio sp. qd031]ORT48900.1 histidine kinase [Vibrio sp. qd031]